MASSSQNPAQNKATIRVLMVCLGNICRSPTAHGVFQKLIEDRHFDNFVKVDSAGTGSWHIGEHPDSRSVLAAAERGYDIASLTARQVELQDFDRFDYIVAMDHANLKELRLKCPDRYRDKLSLLLSFGNSGHEVVPDPYYSGDQGFELVLDLVEEACEVLLETIVQQHSPPKTPVS